MATPKKKEEMFLCAGHGSEFLKCSGMKKESDYYNVWSMFKGNGKSHYCKDCISKIYDYFLELGSMQKAIYYTAQVIDVPFIDEVYEKINQKSADLIKESNKTGKPVRAFNYFGAYISELQKYKTKIDVWNNFSCTNVNLSDVDGRIKERDVKQKELEAFERDWGLQETTEDYLFLIEVFERYTEGIDFVNQQQVDLYRDLCRDRLLLRKMNNLRATKEGRSQIDEATVDKVKNRIDKQMATLKINSFESNKPKTLSEQSLFEKIMLVDENNVKEIYKEPTIFNDHNKIMKYQKDMSLRPLGNMLIGHRNFDINLDDIEVYNLDADN